MSVTFSRRSKVLLALVASMTLTSGLLLALQPHPMLPLSLAGLNTAAKEPANSVAEPQSPPPAALWQRIVIHESGRMPDSLKDMEQRYESEYAGCPYHFVIEADGALKTAPRWLEQRPFPDQLRPAQPGEVHVAIVGQFDRRGPEARQYATLARLINWLHEHHRIPRQAIDASPYANRPGPAFTLPAAGDSTAAH